MVNDDNELIRSWMLNTEDVVKVVANEDEDYGELL